MREHVLNSIDPAHTLEDRLKPQSERFIDKARELGCDECPEAFDRVFARVVPPKTPPEVLEGTRSKRLTAKRRLPKEKPKSS
jgi:hypothetical protein